jgi:hypothetical protein
VPVSAVISMMTILVLALAGAGLVTVFRPFAAAAAALAALALTSTDSTVSVAAVDTVGGTHQRFLGCLSRRSPRDTNLASSHSM